MPKGGFDGERLPPRTETGMDIYSGGGFPSTPSLSIPKERT